VRILLQASLRAMSAQVAPTRMALTLYKGKLVGAKKGYELLKKKSDALKVFAAVSDSFMHCSTEL
jgi:vacuolar-type H+-ATPase subunit D/Vma8